MAASLSDAQNNIPITITSAGTPPNTIQSASAYIYSNPIVDLSFANYFVPTTGPTQLIYPLRIISKAEFYDVTRQSNLTTRPIYIFFNKQPTQSFIEIYPIPDQTYQCQIQVKSQLGQLIQQSSLGNLPPHYYGVLKYAVARKFLSYYPSGNWTPQSEEDYQSYMSIMKNTNETDLTLRPSAIMTVSDPYYWQNILTFS